MDSECRFDFEFDFESVELFRVDADEAVVGWLLLVCTLLLLLALEMVGTG